jgi:error-prone DNA polymerase
MPALAVADLNSVAGIVRAHTKRARAGARRRPQASGCCPAARVVTRGGASRPPCLPRDRAAWARLSPAADAWGGRRAPKGAMPTSEVGDLAGVVPGNGRCCCMPPDQRLTQRRQRPPGMARAALEGDTRRRRLTRRGSRGRCASAGRAALRRPGCGPRSSAQAHRVAARAGAAARRHRACRSCTTARRRRLADVLAAIRLGLPGRGAGAQAPWPNGEGRLRERGRDAAPVRGATRRPWRGRRRDRRPAAAFSLDELQLRVPLRGFTGDETAAGRLARLARGRPGAGAIPKGALRTRCRAQMEHELALIGKLRPTRPIS